MYTTENKQFGKRVQQYREKRNMNQTELGEMVGCTREQISNIERGRSCTPIARIMKICEALKVKPNDLIEIPKKESG